MKLSCSNIKKSQETETLKKNPYVFRKWNFLAQILRHFLHFLNRKLFSYFRKWKFFYFRKQKS